MIRTRQKSNRDKRDMEREGGGGADESDTFLGLLLAVLGGGDAVSSQFHIVPL